MHAHREEEKEEGEEEEEEEGEEEEGEKEDVISFFTKIIIFRLLVRPERLIDFYFFRLKLSAHSDATFQNMLRAIQNFLYFSNSIPPENGL